MVFTHTDNSIKHFSVHQSKIRCTVYKIHLGHTIYHFIKRRFESRHQFVFLTLRLISCDAINSIILFDDIHHLNDNFGSLLQIGINYARKIASCIFQSGINGSLFAKVSAERQNLNPLPILIKKAMQSFKCFIRASVINKNKLIFINIILKSHNSLRIKLFHIIFLVETRNNQR